MKIMNETEASPITTELPVNSPGAILRRCREFHEITLEEASETTKIGIPYLKALEDDKIYDFANKAYLKGFLRIYATYLGLNSDDIAKMYEKLFGVQDEKPTLQQTKTAVSVTRPRIELKKLIFPLLLLAVILITATFFKQSPPSIIRPPQPPAAAPQTAVMLSPLQAVQSSARIKKEVSNIHPVTVEKPSEKTLEPEKAESLPSAVDLPKGFILRIRATQNSTLTATVDGSAAEPYELVAGDVIEWKAAKKVALDLSNAAAVDVELNGKPYKQLGPAGKSMYLELDSNGIIP